jgi:nucleoside diphosphate kinase
MSGEEYNITSSNCQEDLEEKEIPLSSGHEVLLIKPDAFEDGCVPTIMETLYDEGFQIVSIHSVKISSELAREMYQREILDMPEGSDMRKYRIKCADNLVGENLAVVVNYTGEESTISRLNKIKHQSFTGGDPTSSQWQEQKSFYQDIRDQEIERCLTSLRSKSPENEKIYLELLKAYLIEFPEKLSKILTSDPDIVSTAFSLPVNEISEEFLMEQKKKGFVAWTLVNNMRSIRGKVLMPRASRMSNFNDILGELSRNRVHFYRNAKEKDILINVLKKAGLQFKVNKNI